MKDKSGPTDSTLKYYQSNAETFIENTVNVDVSDLYRPFLENMPSTGKILDAGCGSGRDTKFFLEKGYSVVAFDNSPNMVRHAAELTGQEVLLLSFEEIEFKEMFDGIWACASVLHVPENNISTVLSKFTAALKDDGILYTSFKYGEKEQIRNGRFFADYTEERFNQLLAAIPQLELIQYWKTSDLRPGRSDEKWLNILLKRIISA
jgi:SAM-dependent methyltransferase